MPITSSRYRNQLPAICIDLADSVLKQIDQYHCNGRRDRVPLDNTFRLLEMYKVRSLEHDAPYGVLGEEHAEPEDDSEDSKRVDVVNQSLREAIQIAFGEDADERKAVQELELVLAAMAGYSRAVEQLTDKEKVVKAQNFFTSLKQKLSGALQPTHAPA